MSVSDGDAQTDGDVEDEDADESVPQPAAPVQVRSELSLHAQLQGHRGLKITLTQLSSAIFPTGALLLQSNVCCAKRR
jgi:hypothetical protein